MSEIDCRVCAKKIPAKARYCTHCQSYLGGWRQVLNIAPILTPMVVSIATAVIAALALFYRR